MANLIVGRDMEIAQWAFDTFKFHPTKFEMAIGIVEDNQLVGAAMFHAHNGPDIEVSYYGPRTMTLDVVKGLARIAVDVFGVSRITARTTKSNKMMTRGIKKLGFEYEGIRKCGYGAQDAVMFGLYGENLAKLAGKVVH